MRHAGFYLQGEKSEARNVTKMREMNKKTTKQPREITRASRLWLMNISGIWENACFKTLRRQDKSHTVISTRAVQAGDQKTNPRHHHGEVLPVSCTHAGLVCTPLEQRGASQTPSPSPPRPGPPVLRPGEQAAGGRQDGKSVTKVHLQTPTKCITHMSQVVLHRDEVTGTSWMRG